MQDTIEVFDQLQRENINSFGEEIGVLVLRGSVATKLNSNAIFHRSDSFTLTIWSYITLNSNEVLLKNNDMKWHVNNSWRLSKDEEYYFSESYKSWGILETEYKLKLLEKMIRFRSTWKFNNSISCLFKFTLEVMDDGHDLVDGFAMMYSWRRLLQLYDLYLIKNLTVKIFPSLSYVVKEWWKKKE